MTAVRSRTREELVEELVAGRRAGWWRYLGAVAPGEYAVVVTTDAGPLLRQHAADGMSAWLDGWQAGVELVAALEDLPAAGEVPHGVRMLLNCPGVLDQRRIRVAHAMGRRGWTYADIAGELRAQRSTIRGLLRYGGQPARVTKSSRRLEEIEALLPELRRGYGRKPGPLPGLARVQPMAEARLEPAELRRARALALAIEAGLLAAWSPVDVMDLRSARIVRVIDTAGVERRVRVSDVIAWVQGLADGAMRDAGRWPAAARDRVVQLAHALA